MTPESAVSQLVSILASRADFTEDDLYAAMADAGIAYPIADRAYKFTQVAWGRAFLEGLDVNFSADYLCLNAAGDVIESGRLADEPYYAAATAAAGGIRHPPGCRGSPDGGRCAGGERRPQRRVETGGLGHWACGVFMEPPTPAGIERARRLYRGECPPPPEAVVAVLVAGEADRASRCT
jgi:hypothetical protein